MKAPELRGMSDDELVGRIDQLKTEWRDLRFDEAVGKLNAPMRIGQIRREIARIKTIQTERVMAAELERTISQ